MASTLSIILAPLLGGIIGYITNDVAIRMLFRPKNAKYLLGHRVPFTPGLIHKEKGRIAASLGKAISGNLLSPVVLEKNLLDIHLIDKIRSTINNFFIELSHTDDTLGKYLLRHLSEDELDEIKAKVISNLSTQLSGALAHSKLGEKIAHLAVAHVLKKTRDSLLGMLGAELFINTLAEPVENLLASNIDEILSKNSDTIVSNLASQGIDGLLSRRVSDLLQGRENELNLLTEKIIGIYKSVVRNHLPRMLATVDIASMVERRVSEMDAMQVEELIFAVMKKELRAIVWLGAVLGLLMGSINTIISLL